MSAPKVNPLLRELVAAHRTARREDLAQALDACGLRQTGGPIFGVEFVAIDAHNYAPEPGGRPALIVPYFEEGRLLDLVACGLQTRTCRTREGVCTALGLDHIEHAKEAETAVRLFADPIDWLRNGRQGAVIVDWRAPASCWPTFPASHAKATCWALVSRGRYGNRPSSRQSSCGRRRMQPKPPSGFKVYDHANGNGAALASSPWARPVPLVGQIERADYPLGALPEAIRGAVSDVIDAVQVAPEMAASSALAVVSLAAQSMADVRRSETLTGPCSLYFLTVAESGDRKSTVDRLLGRAVWEFQDGQRDAAKVTLASHEADMAAWQARRDAIDGKMAGDAKAGKEIEAHRADLAQLETGKPDAPRVPRLLFEDVTSEKLGKALATEWPSAGIFSSEGGAVLGGHSMGKDSIARTLSLLNKLWDGGSHVVDRATSASFAVRGARMTISLQLQPHVLGDFLDRDRGMSRGSGFLARFLASQPSSLQGSRLYREPIATPELQAFNARIGTMLADLPTIDGERGLLLPTLDLDPIAKAHWVTVYDAVEAQLSSGGDFAPVRDVASKAADNVARLAGVLHVFENGPCGVIGLRSVQAATRIVLWHLYAARGLFAPFTLSREAANAATLDRWLIDRCRMEGVAGFSTRDVLNGGPNGTRKREDFDQAIEVLAAHGRVRLVQDGRRRRLVVNPMLVDGTADDPDDDGADDMPRIEPRRLQGWN